MTNYHDKLKQTDQIIKQSLIQLMQSKAINKISVNNLCDAAQINRSTFYRHFLDKYDVLEKLEQDFIDQLFSIPKNDIHHSATVDQLADQLSIYVGQLLDVIQVNHLNLKTILSEYGDPGFQNVLKEKLSLKIKTSWDIIKLNKTTIDDQLAIDFIAAADVSIIIYTLDHPEISHEKIVETFADLLIKGPLNTIHGK